MRPERKGLGARAADRQLPWLYYAGRDRLLLAGMKELRGTEADRGPTSQPTGARGDDADLAARGPQVTGGRLPGPAGRCRATSHPRRPTAHSGVGFGYGDGQRRR